MTAKVAELAKLAEIGYFTVFDRFASLRAIGPNNEVVFFMDFMTFLTISAQNLEK